VVPVRLIGPAHRVGAGRRDEDVIADVVSFGQFRGERIRTAHACT
jgi:hypothetical protein